MWQSKHLRFRISGCPPPEQNVHTPTIDVFVNSGPLIYRGLDGVRLDRGRLLRPRPLRHHGRPRSNVHHHVRRPPALRQVSSFSHFDINVLYKGASIYDVRTEGGGGFLQKQT